MPEDLLTITRNSSLLSGVLLIKLWNSKTFVELIESYIPGGMLVRQIPIKTTNKSYLVSATWIFKKLPADPADTVRKLNVHKTFRTRPGRLLNVLCTFNLRPVSTGESQGKYVCLPISGKCSHFITPWKHQKSKSILVFSGGIKWEQSLETG